MHALARCGRITALLVLTMLLAACGYTRVPEQYHGIETSFSEITVEKLDNGVNWEGYGTDTHLIPLTEQNYPDVTREDKAPAEIIDNAITRDSMVIAGDIAITWKHNPQTIVRTFREKGGANRDINEAVLFEVQNALRDGFRSAVATQTIEDLIGPNRANFAAVVKQHVQAKLGVKPDSARALIGNVYIRGIRLPQSIVEAREIIIKQAADLKAAQNAKAIAVARADSTVAQAQGEAEANRLRAQSYTSNAKLLDLEIAKALSGICGQSETCVIGASPNSILGLRP